MSPRTACYLRKSTDQSERGEDAKSVTLQRQQALAFAHAQGWVVDDGNIFEDDAISGATFEARPGLQALLAALRTRRFEHLIVRDASRLGREAFETGYLIKRILQGGVRLWFYSEKREITIKDKLLVSVWNVISDGQRDTGRKDTRAALQARAERGLVSGGTLFGYRNVPLLDASGRRTGVDRVIEPSEAAVVVQAYTLYLDGKGFKLIAATLNQQGALAPKPRRKPSEPARGPAWSASTVRDLLINEHYAGRLIWGRSRKRDEWGELRAASTPKDDWIVREREDLRIVPEGLWQQVQNRMRAQRQIYLRNTGGRLLSKPGNSLEARYLLSGMALCGACGGTFVARPSGHRIASRRHVRYTCHSFLVKGSSVCSNNLTLPRAATERAILALIEGTLLRPEATVSALDRAVEKLSVGPDAQAERTRLTAALAKTDRTLKNLVEAIAEATGPLESLLEAVAAKEADKAALAQQLAALDSQAVLRAIDRAALRQRVEATLRAEGWVGLLQAEIPRARQILAKLLVGRLTFTPRTGAEGRYYEVTGRGRLDPILSTVLPLPPALVTPAGFEPAISTLKGSRPWPG